MNSNSQDYYDRLGPWATEKAVMAAFGVTLRRLENWRAENRILGVEFGPSYFYVVHQFENGRIVDGLQEVLTALSTTFTVPEARAVWLSEKAYPDSSATRWDVLRRGQSSRVLEWAKDDARPTA
jgi:hypothetical protein